MRVITSIFGQGKLERKIKSMQLIDCFEYHMIMTIPSKNVEFTIYIDILLPPIWQVLRLFPNIVATDIVDEPGFQFKETTYGINFQGSVRYFYEFKENSSPALAKIVTTFCIRTLSTDLDPLLDYSIPQLHQQQLSTAKINKKHLTLLYVLFEGEESYHSLIAHKIPVLKFQLSNILFCVQEYEEAKQQQKLLVICHLQLQKGNIQFQICLFLNFFQTFKQITAKIKQLLLMHSLKKKQQQLQNLSIFSIYYKYQQDPQYPFLLAMALQKSQEQFQETRAMKLLGDWILQYQKMSEVIKYKYSQYISKIQKVLLNKFDKKRPLEYCLARFLIVFYQNWKKFTNKIIDSLKASESYSIDLIWYLCHSLLEDMDLAKQQPFLQYLSYSFQLPLRMFDPQTYIDARKIVEIIYYINVHGCREQFTKQSNNWAIKMHLFEGAGDNSSLIELNMYIIRNRNILVSNEKSRMYWLKKMTDFIMVLEQNLPKLSADTPYNREILDRLQWIIDIPQGIDLLLKMDQKITFKIFMSLRARQQSDHSIFNVPKYQQLSQRFYNMLFKTQEKKTQLRLKQLLQKFTSHSFSILNDEINYIFLDSYSDHPIFIEVSVINDIFKLLNSHHIRRTLQTRVIILLAKIILAALNQVNLNEDFIYMGLKAFSQCVTLKNTDANANQLRLMIVKLFLAIMKNYSWQDSNKNDIAFYLCEDYDKNSKVIHRQVLQILILLVKKFSYAANSLHKLEPLIHELNLKIIFDQQNIHTFISLLLAIYFSMKWDKAISFIESACLKNKSPLAPFYSFQAQMLIKCNALKSQQDAEILDNILKNREQWVDNKISINLMLLELYFIRFNSQQGLKSLKLYDEHLVNLFTQFYRQGSYKTISQLAAKTLPAAGTRANLEQLQSYRWIRKYSFEMLARSFYKTTSIYVCYIFSNIILKAQNQVQIVHWLCKDQFLDYLYQGLNDFTSKQKKISLELATTILVYRLFELDPTLVPASSKILEFSTLVKNVGWWRQIDDKIYFTAIERNEGSWLLPQFQDYYQQAILDYFKGYIQGYGQKKAIRIKERQKQGQNEEQL